MAKEKQNGIFQHSRRAWEYVFQVLGSIPSPKLTGEQNNCLALANDVLKEVYKSSMKKRTGRVYSRSDARVRDWRERVMRRDRFMCVECKSREDLQVHHIVPWSKNVDLRVIDDNGITLCPRCHIDKHKYIRQQEAASRKESDVVRKKERE
nr:hypothetical protein [Candidatus Saccharibacteria bacterium]